MSATSRIPAGTCGHGPWRPWSRQVSLLVILLIPFGLVSLKLLALEVVEAPRLVRRATAQHERFTILRPHRGHILDRHGRILAMSREMVSVYAVPRRIADPARAARLLAPILRVDERTLSQRLQSRRTFVWVARRRPRAWAEQARRLRLDGIDLVIEDARLYPKGALGSHLLGFVGGEQRGLEGLEYVYQRELSGTVGWRSGIRDAKRRDLFALGAHRSSALHRRLRRGPPRHGHHLVLTIDEVVQYLAERELDAVFQASRATGASIVVLRPGTGEVLALANRPTFDAARFTAFPRSARRNRAVTDVFEPGSSFKIVCAAAALERGVVRPEDAIFCENGAYAIGKHVLHDFHPYGTLSVTDVLVKSSNIGTVKIAQRLGAEPLYAAIRAFGFGSLTRIGFPGESAGLLRAPSGWSGLSLGAVPIGQEVGVTAVQLACAMNTVATGGVWVQPHLVKRIEAWDGTVVREVAPRQVRRVLSPGTAATLRTILAGVVERGTGTRAQVPGYRAAGKTGTAQKALPGRGYQNGKFVAIFVGFVPVERPALLICVTVDEPRGDHFGGTVAAPVFQRVARDALAYLRVPPDGGSAPPLVARTGR